MVAHVRGFLPVVSITVGSSINGPIQIGGECVKILSMATFALPQPDLMPGAKNAVETCLSVKPGEHVALIADEASRSVAASLAAALDARQARCTGLLLEDF